MRDPIRPRLVVVILSVLITAVPARGSDVPTIDYVESTQADLRFRQEFGLPLSSPSNPSPEGFAKYGVNLSEDETEDIDRRFEDQERLDDLLSWATANSTMVGGVWLDQQVLGGRGFQVVIQLTPRGDTLRATALSRVPVGIAARVEIVERSAADLESTVEALIASRAELTSSGVALLSVYTDTRNNVVVAEVAAGGSGPITAIAPDVIVRDGAPLEPVACNPAERCTYLPYRGGLQVLDSDVSFQCTSGFWAKKASLLYMVSGAHCWRFSLNKNVYRYSSSTHLGSWIDDSIPGPGMSCGPAICYANVEAAYFSPDGLLIPSVKNLIYKHATDRSFQITGLKTYANIAQGNAICKAGVTTNYTCGTVTSKGHAVLGGSGFPRYGYLDVDIARAIWTSAATDDGDSGGPVFGGPIAYGFTSAKDGNGNLVASSISYALSDLGLTLCVTSSC